MFTEGLLYTSECLSSSPLNCLEISMLLNVCFCSMMVFFTEGLRVLTGLRVFWTHAGMALFDDRQDRVYAV